MNYDYKKIGERIKKERKLQGMTQEAFAAEYHVKRSTVSKWEHGEAMPNFQTMLDMCAAFDCEMGYLLCEDGYENKTRKTTDICKATGLSEDAIKVLFEIQKERSYRFGVYAEQKTRFVNIFIENCEHLLSEIVSLRYDKKEIETMKKNPHFPIIDEILKTINKTLFNVSDMAADLSFIEAKKEIISDEIEKKLIRKYKKSENEIKKIKVETDNFFLHKFILKEIAIYQQYDIEQSFMDIVKDYIKEGTEDGGKD